MTQYDPFAAQLFIGNEYVSSDQNVRDVINPSTLQQCGRIADATPAVIYRALACAEAARPAWARLDAKARAQFLHAVAQSIETTDKHEVARMMTLEVGKPYLESVGELANFASVFRYHVGIARGDAGKVAEPIQSGSFQYPRYSTYGVRVHIVLYNFPILLMAWTLAASLAAGNVAIVKPVEAGSLCTLKFMEHFRLLPLAVVNLLTGGAAVGKTLVESSRTHVVAFTGSVAAALSVAASWGAHLKPCFIETDGNDPLIVSNKAPLEVAIAGSVTAAFHLSGQICTYAERFLSHADIHGAFVDGLVRDAKALRVGDGLGEDEIGPLVSRAARDKVFHLVDDAVAKGAKLHPVAGFRRIFSRDGSTSPRSCPGSLPKCRSSMKSYVAPLRPSARSKIFWRLSLWQILASSVSAPTSLPPNSQKPCRPWKKSKLGWYVCTIA